MNHCEQIRGTRISCAGSGFPNEPRASLPSGRRGQRHPSSTSVSCYQSRACSHRGCCASIPRGLLCALIRVSGSSQSLSGNNVSVHRASRLRSEAWLANARGGGEMRRGEISRHIANSKIGSPVAHFVRRSRLELVFARPCVAHSNRLTREADPGRSRVTQRNFRSGQPRPNAAKPG